MGAAGTWDRRNNELLTAMSASLAAVSGENDEAVTATSGVVASTAAVATLEPAAGKRTFLTGFLVSGLGATAAAAVTVSVAGVANDDLEFAYVAEEGATVHNDDLFVMFPRPIPAIDDETDIVITCPDLGDGNTHNQVTAFGFYRDSDLIGGTDEAVAAASGNVANAIATATIPAVTGKIAHLTSLRIEGLGATVGSTKTATVEGVAGDDLAYPVVVVAGVSTPNTTVNKVFPFGLPAEDDATDIVVTCPALGAGNTHNLVSAFGFYREA